LVPGVDPTWAGCASLHTRSRSCGCQLGIPTVDAVPNGLVTER
jgi:hypothetical protein